MRFSNRFPAEGTLTFNEQVFALVNISLGGIFVAGPNPPAVGEQIKYRLQITGVPKVLEMDGVVIRHATVDGKAGFAIDFSQFDHQYRKLIFDYITTKM